MEKVVTIVHDTRVYDMLQKQVKTNRKFAAFALVATGYIFLLTRAYNQLDMKLRELTKTEGE